MDNVIEVWLSGPCGSGKTLITEESIIPFAKKHGFFVITIEEDSPRRITKKSIEKICRENLRVLVIHETLRSVCVLGGK